MSGSGTTSNATAPRRSRSGGIAAGATLAVGVVHRVTHRCRSGRVDGPQSHRSPPGRLSPSSPLPHRPASAIACPRNGRPMPAPGCPGPTSATPGRASSRRSSPSWSRRWPALAPGETVHINVLDALHERHVRGLLSGVSGPVRYHRFPTNDAWCRDHGAVFVTRAGPAPLAAVDFAFNAWGGKYPPMTSTTPSRGDGRGPRHPAFPVNALLKTSSILAPGLAVPDYRAVAGIAWRTPPPSARWCYSSPTCAMKTATRSRPPLNILHRRHLVLVASLRESAVSEILTRPLQGFEAALQTRRCPPASQCPPPHPRGLATGSAGRN